MTYTKTCGNATAAYLLDCFSQAHEKKETKKRQFLVNIHRCGCISIDRLEFALSIAIKKAQTFKNSSAGYTRRRRRRRRKPHG